jgi:hypothetical protein
MSDQQQGPGGWLASDGRTYIVTVSSVEELRRVADQMAETLGGL